MSFLEKVLRYLSVIFLATFDAAGVAFLILGSIRWGWPKPDFSIPTDPLVFVFMIMYFGAAVGTFTTLCYFVAFWNDLEKPVS